jgi:CheY-like chemotaxis protein
LDEPRAGAVSILLVDPGPTLRTVARLHLTGARFDVAEVASADAALAAIGRRRVDLAIAPARCGQPLLAELRKHADERVRALPLLLVSEAPGGRAAARAGEPGVRVLAAPVTGPRLFAAVDELLAPRT